MCEETVTKKILSPKVTDFLDLFYSSNTVKHLFLFVACNVFIHLCKELYDVLIISFWFWRLNLVFLQ